MKRVPALDGLRAIAVLMVVSFHYLNNQLLQNEVPVFKFISQITSFGWLGVDLFFVLSGFFIGSIVLNASFKGQFFKHFYIRRFLRIVPNYYLFILLFFSVTLFIPEANSYFLAGNFSIPNWSYFTLSQNIWMAIANNMGNPALSVTWSIGIEEQFYLIFPFLVLLTPVRLRYLLYVILILVAIYMRYIFEDWVTEYTSLISRMDALTIGWIVADLYKSTNDQKLNKKTVNRMIFTVCILTAVSIVTLYLNFGDLSHFKHTLFALVFMGMLWAVLNVESIKTNNVLNWPPLVLIGQLSYSVYLYHYFMLGLLHYLILNNGYIVLLTFQDAFVTLIAFIVTIIWSWIVYKYLEQPLMNWAKKFNY